MKLKELMEYTNKKMPHLYLDMDGVQADFFGAWARKHNVGNYKEIPDTETSINELASSSPLEVYKFCLLYTSPSPRDRQKSRMPSSA